MLISLRRVGDKILGGRQLVTESLRSTVTALSDNWWAVFRYHDTNTVLYKSIAQVFYFLIKGSLIRFHICIIPVCVSSSTSIVMAGIRYVGYRNLQRYFLNTC